MNAQHGHLSAEMAQACLDGRASAEDVRLVEEHVGRCDDCRAAYDEWQAVYGRLGHLDVLEPSANFATSVMERFQHERALTAAAFDADGHLTVDALLEHLDGQLVATEAHAAKEHLAACSQCTSAEAEWAAVFGSLADIEHLVPSPAFTESVLAAARVGTIVSAAAPLPARVPLRTRVARAATRWVGTAVARVRSRDRRSLAVLAGLGTAPAAVLATLGWVVLTHPLVTTSGLVRFAWLQAMQLGDALASMIVRGASDSALLYALYSGFEFVASAPGVAALGVLAVLAMTSVSTWVLFKNLAPMRRTAARTLVRANG